MSIAQRLCNEIVEPVINTPQNYTTYNTSRKLMVHTPITPSKHHGPASRSIVVQKKKVVSKLTPRNASGTRIVLDRLKSKETIFKKHLIDAGVNTYISGPLKCDNDCVTNVRKRETRCVCKCSHGRLTNCRASAKHIQTQNNLNYLLADKACAQVVETVSCGTQFLDKLGSVTTHKKERPKVMVNKETMALLITPATVRNERPLQETHFRYTSQRPPHVDYISKRWALSPYPVRGPDF